MPGRRRPGTYDSPPSMPAPLSKVMATPTRSRGSSMFRALLLDETGGTVTASIRELDDSTLPDGNVTVAVDYTTINYKDGLVISGGGGGLVKRWPHVPGIDFAGTVRMSEHSAYRVGDKV